MTFAEDMLNWPQRPDSIRGVELPRYQSYPSPVDWREEVLYFLLVDRFSDGNEDRRPKLDKGNLNAARKDWKWSSWAESGAKRWQGGTISGVTSKLDYLRSLGVTAIWLSPVFKQRAQEDSYHGYGIQDFLDVDPRFGDRRALVDLVSAAHDKGIRVILDIVFNHSGCNWIYPEGKQYSPWTPPYLAADSTPNSYPFGAWRGLDGRPAKPLEGGETPTETREHGIWPKEFRDPDCYTRAGYGNLGSGDVDNDNAEHKRTDFIAYRDFNLYYGNTLNDLAKCYSYWIALTDCDGFRIDTLKHAPKDAARNFCGSIKEYAAEIGKDNFFLVGEVAGSDYDADRYLDALERNMNAVLDIGEMRRTLIGVAKGIIPAKTYFDSFSSDVMGSSSLGSHRNLGNRHVSIMDDHDHVSGEKVRFSSDASSDHQVAACVAMQLFTLGIPCIYYGTEQAFAGPEKSERVWLESWNGSDNYAERYLREAMFGPEHPRAGGLGWQGPAGFDEGLPGFGPFGTAGVHCFDRTSPAYRRIAAFAALRKSYPTLRHGRQYLRPISIPGDGQANASWSEFGYYGPGQVAGTVSLEGQIVAWSRILSDSEFVCIVNAHGNSPRSADVLVDSNLNQPGSSMRIVLSTVRALDVSGCKHCLGQSLEVKRVPKPDGTPEGKAYVEIRDLPPSEVLVLSNHS